MNEIIANEKDVDNEVFLNYFKYQNPSFLAKDLIRAMQAKSEQLVNDVNLALTDLRKAINRKEIPENENPKKGVHIVEKILNFKKQQNGKGRPSDLANRIKILTPKQMLERLPMAHAHVEAGNTSENLLNEMRQIVYSLYQTKEITSKCI